MLNPSSNLFFHMTTSLTCRNLIGINNKGELVVIGLKTDDVKRRLAAHEPFTKKLQQKTKLMAIGGDSSFAVNTGHLVNVYHFD